MHSHAYPSDPKDAVDQMIPILILPEFSIKPGGRFAAHVDERISAAAPSGMFDA